MVTIFNIRPGTFPKIVEKGTDYVLYYIEINFYFETIAIRRNDFLVSIAGKEIVLFYTCRICFSLTDGADFP